MNEVRELLSHASPGPWRAYMDGAEGVIELGNGETLRVRGSSALKPADIALLGMAYHGAEVVAAFGEDGQEEERTDEGQPPAKTDT